MPWDKAARDKYKRIDNYMQCDLTGEEWEVIKTFLPGQGRMGRPRKTCLRAVFNAIQYMLGTGCQWLAIPSYYPPFSTVQNYFYSWIRSGVLQAMLNYLCAQTRQLTSVGRRNRVRRSLIVRE